MRTNELFVQEMIYLLVAVSLFLFGRVLLGGGESDLVEDELGDGVGEGRGNWEPWGFGFVSLGIGNVAQFEVLAIGESEGDGSLSISTVSGSGGLDAITSFGVGAVFSSGAGVHTVVLEDGDFIGFGAVWGRGGVAGVGGGGSHGQKAGEDDLRKIQNNGMIWNHQLNNEISYENQIYSCNEINNVNHKNISAQDYFITGRANVISCEVGFR